MTIERTCGCGEIFTCIGDECKIKYRMQECLCPVCLLNYAQRHPHTHAAIPKALDHCFSGLETKAIEALVRFSTQKNSENSVYTDKQKTHDTKGTAK